MTREHDKVEIKWVDIINRAKIRFFEKTSKIEAFKKCDQGEKRKKWKPVDFGFQKREYTHRDKTN